MAEIGKRAHIAVSYIGKIKTAVQMFSLVMLLAYQPHHPEWLGITGYFLLLIAAGLTLWSMVMYLRAALPDLTAP